MISVVMPYWKRLAVLEANLSSYEDFYRNEDIEIIVVDDGSGELKPNWNYGPMVSVLRLPLKDVALNPCVAFNEGVRESTGDIIVLTNPEVIHRFAILSDMQERLEQLGENGYVAAACWCASQKMWYCHSTLQPKDEDVGRAKVPKGAGYHFCSMMYRKLYDRVGGFTEDYRQGQGYEDNDFLWKLEFERTKFLICDDLITDHYDCPRTQWPKGGAERNKAIFESRWHV